MGCSYWLAGVAEWVIGHCCGQRLDSLVSLQGLKRLDSLVGFAVFEEAGQSCQSAGFEEAGQSCWFCSG